jgi:hypothetical protein
MDKINCRQINNTQAYLKMVKMILPMPTSPNGSAGSPTNEPAMKWKVM